LGIEALERLYAASPCAAYINVFSACWRWKANRLIHAFDKRAMKSGTRFWSIMNRGGFLVAYLGGAKQFSVVA
jgi:hypothetical protein